MAFQERRALVSLAGTIAINVLYAAYMVERYPAGDAYSEEVFRFWGQFFVYLILVSIVAKIIIHIIFSILNTIVTQEAEPGITDERDELIELRVSRNSQYAFIAGFVLAMLALVAGQPPSVMFILLLCAGLSSQIVGDASEFLYYSRGF